MSKVEARLSAIERTLTLGELAEACPKCRYPRRARWVVRDDLDGPFGQCRACGRTTTAKGEPLAAGAKIIQMLEA